MLIFIFMYSKSLNINDTFSYWRNYLSEYLIGNPSSNFPGSSFLNYVSYGSNIQQFGYKEFLLNYGFKDTDCRDQSIIIGNDGMLGGFCFGFNYKFIIPVPRSTIQMIPLSSISDYFPKGYTILRNPKYFDSIPYSGTLYSSTDSSTICDPCNIDLRTYEDAQVFSYGSLFGLYQQSNSENFYINFFGYFQQANQRIKNGIMNVYFTISSYSPTFNIFDPNSHPLINFVIDSNNQMKFQGNFQMKINDELVNYKFNGTMSPN